MIKRVRLVGFLMAFVFITACSDSGDQSVVSEGALVVDMDSMQNQQDNQGLNTKEIQVNHYKVPCQGLARTTCLLVRNTGETQWQFYYSDIAGFDFEWGYEYQLNILESEIENPPADGSSLQWDLEKQVSKIEVARESSFELALQLNQNLAVQDTDVVELSNDLFQFIDGTQFTCEPVICQSFRDLSAQNMSVLARFEYGHAKVEPLILAELVCASSESMSFALNCPES